MEAIMGNSIMGRVLVSGTVQNLADIYKTLEGSAPPESVRGIRFQDALVDTAATFFCLPKKYIQQLGLMPVRKRRLRTTVGIREAEVYSNVRLIVQGRECDIEVAEVPDDCPALIGQIPLEILDFVVDPVGQRLIGNPEHHGEQMGDEFRVPPRSVF
jgi:predicted aspartyl protease